MSKAIRLLSVVFVLIFLAGCGVKYAPRVPGFCPGYTDNRLGEYTYQVVIGEAWSRDWPNLEKFAVYRAAELTKNSGRNYYVVLSASSRITTSSYTTPTTATTVGSINTVGNTAYLNSTTRYSGGNTISAQGGWYYLDFKMISDGEISDYNQVVSADKVMAELQYFIDKNR